MSFGFILVTFALVAVLIMAWSLLGRKPVSNVAQEQRIQRNVNLYRQRLQEIEQDFSKAYIDEAECELLKTELARRLLNDVGQLEAAPQQTHERRKWLLLFVPLPLLAILFYQSLGAYPDWKISQQLADLAKSQSVEEYQTRLTAVHAAIESRLLERPDNIEYRIMLARYAMGQEQYADAALHYGVLAELLPEDADALGYYAQAEFLNNGRRITAVVAKYMDKALSINPMQPTVLGMQGMYAYEQQDYALAVEAWEKLLQSLDPGSRQAGVIRQGIAQAKEALGVVEEPAAEAVEGPALSVSVDLDKSLHHLDARLAVFIYAKAVRGPPAPLAVKKVSLSDLPLTLSLDDSMAMMAGMNITSHKDVIVGARISNSGRPIPQAGDWQVEKTVADWQKAGAQTLLIKDPLP